MLDQVNDYDVVASLQVLFANPLEIGESGHGAWRLPRGVETKLPNISGLRSGGGNLFERQWLVRFGCFFHLVTAPLSTFWRLGERLEPLVESALRLRAMAWRLAARACSRCVCSVMEVSASVSANSNSLRMASTRASKASCLRLRSRSMRSASCWRLRAAAASRAS